ncbi:hypothetical protein LIER_38311 [Lithospermum erythrorhizon]|uniref:4Fe-4S ferredoxin-type domain-containing protein n=1 Tax=Lithospermum erythrorhizon TaxID=34254 RepID=A0AAV3PXY4_LITER
MEEVKKLRAFVLILVILGMLIGQSSATFKDCYAKCLFSCMIEPSQNLCSCTTTCLKNCIFYETHQQNLEQDSNSRSLSFCKLGCAFSRCTGVSSKLKIDAETVDGCVGSCSKACNKNYFTP